MHEHLQMASLVERAVQQSQQDLMDNVRTVLGRILLMLRQETLMLINMKQLEPLLRLDRL